MQIRRTRMLALVSLTVLTMGMGLTVAACGKYSINSLRALKAFSEANKLYRSSDYKGAAARYEAVIRLNPDLGYAYFFLGNSYDNLYKPAKKGDPENDVFLEKAVANYRLATEKLATGKGSTDPREAEFRKLSYEYLIASYGSDKLNDLAQAEPIAKQLIAMEPNEPTNYFAMGKLYEDAGRYEEAEAMFKKAIEVRPNDPAGYLVLAGYYNRQGDFDKTIEAFESRARVEPNNPEAWHTMSTYFQEKVYKDVRLPVARQKEYVDKAIADDDKALALNPDYAEAMIFKNILLRMQARYEKDPAKQTALLKQADDLREKGIALQKKQSATATPTRKGG